MNYSNFFLTVFFTIITTVIVMTPYIHETAMMKCPKTSSFICAGDKHCPGCVMDVGPYYISKCVDGLCNLCVEIINTPT